MQVQALPSRLGSHTPVRAGFITRKEVARVATKDEYLNAAKKSPSARTAAEQHLVDKGKNMQDVRNADFEAHRHERTHGPTRR